MLWICSLISIQTLWPLGAFGYGTFRPLLKWIVYPGSFLGETRLIRWYFLGPPRSPVNQPLADTNVRPGEQPYPSKRWLVLLIEGKINGEVPQAFPSHSRGNHESKLSQHFASRTSKNSWIQSAPETLDTLDTLDTLVRCCSPHITWERQWSRRLFHRQRLKSRSAARSARASPQHPADQSPMRETKLF